MPFLFRICILLLATLTYVIGLGCLIKPRPSYIIGMKIAHANAIIDEEDNSAHLWKNASVFHKNFPQLGKLNLREYFHDKNVTDCKNTALDIPAVETTNMHNVTWGELDGSTKTLEKNDEGPCEVWIDDIRVFRHWNCAVLNHNKLPVNFPVNFSVCQQERCILRVYWLAVVPFSWKLHNHCVPITNHYSPGTVNGVDQPQK